MIKLYFEAIAMIDDIQAIAVRYESNGLFKVNMQTGECSYIGMIPNEKITSKRLYVKAVRMGEKVYFIPSSAREIAVYNVNTGDIYKIPYRKVDEETKGYKRNSNFNGCAVHGKYIFMVPCTYPQIVKIDTENDTLSYYGDWNQGERFKFRKSVEIDGNCFYTASVISGYVLQFDMETCEGILRPVGQNNQGCWDIHKVKDCFWLSPQWEGPIIKWNIQTDEIIEIDGYPDGFEGNKMSFTKVYDCKDRIYILPGLANMGVMVSTDQNMIEIIDIPELQNVKETLLMFEMDNRLYLKVTDENGVKDLILDMGDNSISDFSFLLSKGEKEFKTEYSQGMYEERGKMKEDMGWKLEDFLNYI